MVLTLIRTLKESARLANGALLRQLAFVRRLQLAETGSMCPSSAIGIAEHVPTPNVTHIVPEKAAA